MQKPSNMFWLPLEHACGCAVDWGADAHRRNELAYFFVAAAPYACPWHGSTSGRPAKEPAIGEEVHFVAADLWYRKTEPSMSADARRNREIALGQRPPRSEEN